MFVCIHIHPTKSFTATFVHLGLFETNSFVLGRNRKKWTYMPLFVRTGLRYLKAKNKPKYNNILHVLEVSTYFLHQTHKVG